MWRRVQNVRLRQSGSRWFMRVMCCPLHQSTYVRFLGVFAFYFFNSRLAKTGKLDNSTRMWARMSEMLKTLRDSGGKPDLWKPIPKFISGVCTFVVYRVLLVEYKLLFHHYLKHFRSAHNFNLVDYISHLLSHIISIYITL